MYQTMNLESCKSQLANVESWLSQKPKIDKYKLCTITQPHTGICYGDLGIKLINIHL